MKITIEAFKYMELSEKAKQKAQNWLMESMDFEPGSVKKEFENLLEKLGFYNVKTEFSGFHFQGSGANFSARIRASDLPKCNSNSKEWASIKSDLPCMGEWKQNFDFPAWFFDIDGLCEISGGDNYYSHSHTMRAELESGQEIGQEIEISLENEFLEFCRDLADWYYTNLENSYEYEISEENFKDICETNEFLFNERGEFIQ